MRRRLNIVSDNWPGWEASHLSYTTCIHSYCWRLLYISISASFEPDVGLWHDFHSGWLLIPLIWKLTTVAWNDPWHHYLWSLFVLQHVWFHITFPSHICIKKRKPLARGTCYSLSHLYILIQDFTGPNVSELKTSYTKNVRQVWHELGSVRLDRLAPPGFTSVYHPCRCPTEKDTWRSTAVVAEKKRLLTAFQSEGKMLSWSGQ